jgi:uncharacterized protein YegP (UPF0339 family)
MYRIEIYRRKDGKWSWRLLSTANGKKVGGDMAQGYSRRIDCKAIVEGIFGDKYPIEITEARP